MAELYIKNMVCARCVMVVRQELVALGMEPLSVDLGIVHLAEVPPRPQMETLSERLQALGFELLDDTKAKMIEQIKNIVISRIHHSDHPGMSVNWSELIASEMNHDYSYLSALFSSVEGITLEQYIIRQKIEKAKELLFYDEYNLNEISYKLGYSSAQHLSSQFKKITGQTPSQFRAARGRENLRRSIDSVA